MTDDEARKYLKLSVNNQPAPWLLRDEFDTTDQSEAIENGTVVDGN